MKHRIPEPRPGFFGPPYFEIHAEGWALIIVLIWLFGSILAAILA